MSLADDIEKLLKDGGTSIGIVASYLNRTPEKVLSAIRNHPEKFDVVGICGTVSTFHISLTDKERPLQLVLDKAWRE